jgi:hypothetical protein
MSQPTIIIEIHRRKPDAVYGNTDLLFIFIGRDNAGSG